MKVRNVEGVATHNGPESCVGRGNSDRRSVDRGTRGPGIEPRNPCPHRGADAVEEGGRPHPTRRQRKAPGPRAVRDPVQARTHRVREPGDPAVLCGDERRRAASGSLGTHADDARRKSDRVAPRKPPNNAGHPAAEAAEGSGGPRGTARSSRRPDTAPGNFVGWHRASIVSGSQEGQETAVHRAAASRLRRRRVCGGVSRSEARRRRGH